MFGWLKAVAKSVPFVVRNVPEAWKIGKPVVGVIGKVVKINKVLGRKEPAVHPQDVKALSEDGRGLPLHSYWSMIPLTQPELLTYAWGAGAHGKIWGWQYHRTQELDPKVVADADGNPLVIGVAFLDFGYRVLKPNEELWMNPKNSTMVHGKRTPLNQEKLKL